MQKGSLMSEEDRGAKGSVLLGVSGCIAAYKAPEIVRALQKVGLDVEVIMTENATEFVSPLTFEALTNKPVRYRTFGDPTCPIPHISAAERADLFVIAPCTANVIGKIANGIADDLLTSVALAAHDRMMVAPAMNVHMYESDAVGRNLEILRSRNVRIIEPDQGYLACGDTGKGRLPSPEEIAERIIDAFREQNNGLEAIPDSDVEAVKGRLSGKRVLITAGPTRERIDSVRYITNDSSGKMGYALAQAARAMGAHVVLVTGPVGLEAPQGADVIDVESADDMFIAAESEFSYCDIAIFSAAVADIRPKIVYDRKLKKGHDGDALRTIELVENRDILATLASIKRSNQFVIGFAAETDDLIRNAKAKLASKGADMIVANEVGEGKAFGKDVMSATIITASSEITFNDIDKSALAYEILNEACDMMA